MIRPYPLSKLTREMELVPQAIIGTGISELASRGTWRLEEGQDGLDEFVGAAFLILGSSGIAEEHTPFAIMHYKGHPRATSTIYLPFEVQNVSTITDLISTIADELDISEKIIWQRKDRDRTLPA